jgi:hypothetical protein
LLPTSEGNTITSGKEDDSLFWDILLCLSLSDGSRLQWHDLRDKLYQRYRNTYEKETFDTLFGRTLKHIRQDGYAKPDNRGHQKVFYFIPKQKQKEVTEKLSRRFAHKKLDEYWDTLSLEQKRKSIENLMVGQQMLVQAEKSVLEELVRFYLKQAEDRLGTENNYTANEQLKFKTIIDETHKTMAQMDSSETANDKYLREKWLEHFKLTVEFEKEIVFPYYNGCSYQAIADLMRKAIAEQKAEHV